MTVVKERRDAIGHLVVLLGAAMLSSTALAQLPAEARFKDLRQHLMEPRGTKKVDIVMLVTPDGITIERKKTPPLVIPYSAITGITYDQRSKVRRMAPDWGKAIDHFLIIRYKLGDLGDFVEIEAEKGVAAPLVNTLEVRSGLKIERTSSGS